MKEEKLVAQRMAEREERKERKLNDVNTNNTNRREIAGDIDQI